MTSSLSLWQQQLSDWVRTACELEVTSPKPGNVSPDCEFSNATVQDFLTSAESIAPQLAIAETRPIGQTILAAVNATQTNVGHNTNLGIILLLTPLAAVPSATTLLDGIDSVLSRTTLDDSVNAYEAIRLASPAGLGDAQEQDLHDEPTLPLRACMELAAERDMIACQYTNGFRDVLVQGQDWLQESSRVASELELRIQWLAVRMLAEYGDSLIERKCGREMSRTVQQMAYNLINGGWPGKTESLASYQAFDSFLRADGNQRNPGTTADLVAAVLFAALRERQMVAPEPGRRIAEQAKRRPV